MVKYLIILLLSLVPLSSVQAVLVVTEVMANEPGSSTSLEWVEIYNNNSSNQPLNLFQINLDGSILPLPSTSLSPYSYLILCKDIIAYENFWGDGSGIWGDDPLRENYLLYDIGSFSLANDSGRVELLFGNPISTISWDSAGIDGFSWERFHQDSAEIHQSVHPTGSTPGRVNSRTPLDFDLALLDVGVLPLAGGETSFEIIIANVGLFNMPAGELELYYDNDTDQVVLPVDQIGLINYPATGPGDTITINSFLYLNGVNPFVYMTLPTDSRIYNNWLSVPAYGTEYPPVHINEFIADPDFDLGTEWVELKNRSSIEINLKDWYLGDNINLNRITSDDLFISPGEYLVLTTDSLSFFGYYGDSEIDVMEPPTWPALNNDGDIIRLRDITEVVVDSVIYELTFGDNYSWGRNEGSGDGSLWGRSRSIGGTPGMINEIYLGASGEAISVEISPDPFSPVSDGITVIKFTNPPGDNLSIKIFDLKGRRVVTLIDKVPSFDGFVTWDGTDTDGQRLPIGMYIVYLEVAGVASHKMTVVIAP